jgi:hypothetical protein
MPAAFVKHFDQSPPLACIPLPDPHDTVMHHRAALQPPIHFVAEILFRARQKGDAIRRELTKQRKIRVAQVDNQQHAAFQRRLNVRPEALVVGLWIGVVPKLNRQPRTHIQQRGHLARQRVDQQVFE